MFIERCRARADIWHFLNIACEADMIIVVIIIMGLFGKFLRLR